MNTRQLRIIKHILNSPPTYVYALAKALEVAPSNVYRVIGNLVSCGIVEKCDAPPGHKSGGTATQFYRIASTNKDAELLQKIKALCEKEIEKKTMSDMQANYSNQEQFKSASVASMCHAVLKLYKDDLGI